MSLGSEAKIPIWVNVVTKKRAARELAIKRHTFKLQRATEGNGIALNIPDKGDFEYLQNAISSGTLSTVEVVLAYISRYVSDLTLPQFVK